MKASVGRSHQQSVVGHMYYITNQSMQGMSTGAILVWLYGETNYFMAGFEACSIRGTSHLVWKPGQKPVASRSGKVLS